MQPTLNQADIKLLKSVFEPLIQSAVKTLENKLMAEIEKDRLILAKYFEGAKFEQRLDNHEDRIKTVEDHLGIQPAF